jgi:hypothetical protein
MHIYFRLKCNVLSSHPSSTLHVSAVYGHHQGIVYLAKNVAWYMHGPSQHPYLKASIVLVKSRNQVVPQRVVPFIRLGGSPA